MANTREDDRLEAVPAEDSTSVGDKSGLMATIEPIATLASRIRDAESVDKSAGQTAGTRPG